MNRYYLMTSLVLSLGAFAPATHAHESSRPGDTEMLATPDGQSGVMVEEIARLSSPTLENLRETATAIAARGNYSRTRVVKAFRLQSDDANYETTALLLNRFVGGVMGQAPTEGASSYAGDIGRSKNLAYQLLESLAGDPDIAPAEWRVYEKAMIKAVVGRHGLEILFARSYVSSEENFESFVFIDEASQEILLIGR